MKIDVTLAEARAAETVLSMILNDPDWRELLGGRDWNALARLRDKIVNGAVR